MILENFDNLYNDINDISIQESDSLRVFDEEVYNEIAIEKILDENVQFVNEAYVGKTPILEKIEEQIGIMRSKLSRYDDFDRLPDVQKINRLFEEQFGMKIFALHMEKEDIMNAYTMVIALNTDIYKKDFSKYITANRKDGYRFTNDNNFCISATVYYGLLSNPDLTDAEILAIILHEIGHNFADFIDNSIKIANKNFMAGIWASVIMDILSVVFLLRGIKDAIFVSNKMNNEKKSKEETKNQTGKERKLSGALSGVKGKIKDFFTVTGDILYKYNIFALTYNKIIKPLYDNSYNKTAAKKSIGRKNEIIADKFAAIYGYGPELGTGLMKMNQFKTKSKAIMEKLPFGKKLLNSWEKVFINMNEFDCHPHTVQRIMECIKTLKDELEQEDMDPKMKAAIKAQIKEMEDNIAKVKAAVEKDPENLKKAYAAYVANKLPDATTKEIEDKINEEFNKLLKESFGFEDGEILNEGDYTFGQAIMGFRISPHQNLDKTLKTHQYPGMLNLVKKLKKVEDLQYLRKDTNQGISTIQTIREKIKEGDPSNKWVKKGITVQDCNLTIKWFKEVLLKEISNRIKEIKNK